MPRSARSGVLLVAAALALAGPLAPDEGKSRIEEIGDCIAANSPRLSAVHSLTIEVTDPFGEVSTTRATVLWRRFGEVGRLLVEIEAPEDLAGSRLLVVPQAEGRPAAWVFLPELGKAKRVRSAAQVRGVLRGDLQLGEVRRLVDFSDGLDLRLLGEEEVAGRSGWRVAADAPSGAGEAYDAFEALVDAEFCLPLRLEFLAGGVAVKRITIDSEAVVRVAESWLPRRLLVEDLESGSVSRLEIGEIQLELPLAPARFTPDALEGGDDGDE